MSVIVEVRIPSTDFELGQILSVEGMTFVELESLVPTGEATVPLFWVYNSNRDSILDTVQCHSSVNSASEVDVFDDRTLFTLDWDARKDHVFEGIIEHEGQVLSASGTPEVWEFELRFPGHDELGDFRAFFEDSHLSLEVVRVYNPTNPGIGPWYGLTEPQREAIGLAVRLGYYDIPRGCTTKELASDLGISDQAVTERLRRGVVALVTQALLTDDTAA